VVIFQDVPLELVADKINAAEPEKGHGNLKGCKFNDEAVMKFTQSGDYNACTFQTDHARSICRVT
jgi:hypothetical protein